MLFHKNVYSILGEINGKFGVYFEDIQTGEKLTINPDEQFSAASTIKIPLVSLLFKKAEKGEINLAEKIHIDEENRVGGTGVIRDINIDYEPTLLDLATLAIIVSDNIATNVLLDVVGGFSQVTDFCQELGLKGTKFQRKMLDLDALNSGRDNFTTARDMGNMLKMLVNNEVVSEDVSKKVINIMKKQQFRQKLPSLIPAVASYDPKANDDSPNPGSVIVANKTGDLWKVQHDVGIFILPNNIKYVLAIFTSNLNEDSEGIRIIGEVSKVIYDEMSRKYE